MWLFVFIGIVTLDWLSKWAAHRYAAGNESGLVTPVVNTDLALGILPVASPVIVLLVLAMACVAVFVHATYLTRSGDLAIWVTASLGAGVVANLLDRIATGAVHDWLNLTVAIANIADVALLAGMIAYLVCVWRVTK